MRPYMRDFDRFMDSGKKEGVATQIHQIYIRATPEAIWNAITTPEWTSRYGYRARTVYELKPGRAYQSRSTAQMRSMGLPAVIIDGEVVDANPPRRRVHTLRFLFSEQNRAEGFTRITWEIEPSGSRRRRMVLDHQRPEVAPGDRKAAGRLIRQSDRAMLVQPHSPSAKCGVANG